jgi:hypothetical protein
MLCLLAISITQVQTYAQTSSTMNKATSGGSLNVMSQASPNPIKKGTQTNFKVTFDQKGSKVVQPHIDYLQSQKIANRYFKHLH